MTLDHLERWTRWIAAATGMATLVFALWKGIWSGLQRPPGHATGAAAQLLRAPVQLLFGALWMALCVLLWRPITLTLSVAVRVGALMVGTWLFFLGLGLYWWGALTLEDMYRPASALGVQLKAGHRLITHGPFALVRHPLYLGLQLAAFGGLLIFRTWTLVFVVLNFLGLTLRARREEEALAAEFGEEWETYARRVPGWLPRRVHRKDPG